MGPRLLRAKEINGLLVPPGKAYKLLTDHLITGHRSGFSMPRKCGSIQTPHTSKPVWFTWMVMF